MIAVSSILDPKKAENDACFWFDCVQIETTERQAFNVFFFFQTS